MIDLLTLYLHVAIYFICLKANQVSKHPEADYAKWDEERCSDRWTSILFITGLNTMCFYPYFYISLHRINLSITFSAHCLPTYNNCLLFFYVSSHEQGFLQNYLPFPLFLNTLLYSHYLMQLISAGRTQLALAEIYMGSSDKCREVIISDILGVCILYTWIFLRCFIFSPAHLHACL